MNTHKKKDIIDSIRSRGRLPTDPSGQVLSPDELLIWFGLDACLNRTERLVIKEELEGLIDAERALDILKSYEAIRGGD